VVEAAERILATDIRVTGTAAPAEVFDAEAWLRALCPEHISLELADSPADLTTEGGIGTEQRLACRVIGAGKDSP